MTLRSDFAELRFTWDELNAAVCNAPRRIVHEVDGRRVSYHDGAEQVALLVARRIGVRLVVERDDTEVIYEPLPELEEPS